MVCKIRNRIDVSPAFVAFLCAYYYFDPADTFAPFLWSITLHEAGHLFALRLCSAKIHRLRLNAFGATIITGPLCYYKELFVAASGPAMNLLLLIAAQKSPALALINLSLFAYNLLPIYPLDGGRILRALLGLLLPTRAADILERVIGAICLGSFIGLACYLTCVWHAGLWPVLVAAILFLHVAEMILPKNRKLRV